MNDDEKANFSILVFERAHEKYIKDTLEVIIIFVQQHSRLSGFPIQNSRQHFKMFIEFSQGGCLMIWAKRFTKSSSELPI